MTTTELLRLAAILTETSLISFILYRFIRWHVYYSNKNKDNKEIITNNYQVIRQPDWCRFPKDLQVHDYSEGRDYIIRK